MRSIILFLAFSTCFVCLVEAIPTNPPRTFTRSRTPTKRVTLSNKITIRGTFTRKASPTRTRSSRPATPTRRTPSVSPKPAAAVIGARFLRSTCYDATFAIAVPLSGSLPRNVAIEIAEGGVGRIIENGLRVTQGTTLTVGYLREATTYSWSLVSCSGCGLDLYNCERQSWRNPVGSGCTRTVITSGEFSTLSSDESNCPEPPRTVPVSISCFEVLYDVRNLIHTSMSTAPFRLEDSQRQSAWSTIFAPLNDDYPPHYVKQYFLKQGEAFTWTLDEGPGYTGIVRSPAASACAPLQKCTGVTYNFTIPLTNDEAPNLVADVPFVQVRCSCTQVRIIVDNGPRSSSSLQLTDLTTRVTTDYTHSLQKYGGSYEIFDQSDSLILPNLKPGRRYKWYATVEDSLWAGIVLAGEGTFTLPVC